MKLLQLHAISRKYTIIQPLADHCDPSYDFPK